MSETTWQANIDAYEQTVRSMHALGGELRAEDWPRPTDCPGWSVKDQFSHVLGVERWLAGDVDDGVRRTVANTAIDVEALRDTPVEKILDALADVLDRRLAVLRAGGIDLTEEIETPFGRIMPYGDFMAFRAFDIWMHEQDARRAAGRPGNLDGPAADRSRRILEGALLTTIGKRAAAAPGQSVVVETPEYRWRVEVGEDQRARFSDAEVEPVVHLRMEWETFFRLGGGRVDGNDADVEIAGDADLAGRILTRMAVTP